MDGHILAVFTAPKRTTVINLPNPVWGEHDENIYSKNFTPSQIEDIADALVRLPLARCQREDGHTITK